MAFSRASTTSPAASANAPPDPPSPVMTTTTGVRRRVSMAMLRAIASATPRSSEADPGKAPGVSTNVTTGRPSRSARAKRRIALR